MSTLPMTPSSVVTCDMCDDPMLFIVQYIPEFPDPLDGRRFAAICPSRRAQTFCDSHHGRKHDPRLVCGRNVGGSGAAAELWG